MTLWESLRTWPRDAYGWVGKHPAAKIVLGISAGLVALCLVAPEMVADHLERLGALFPYYGGDTARITVEVPAIHTRERLINDRNDQVAWIDEELRRMTAQSSFLPERQAGTPAAGPNADDGGPAAPGEGGSVRLRSGHRASTSLAERPLDRFKELNAFREVVRTERAHAMLDDRHDLDGDTLYFLSFDATVLPGRRSRGYAVVSAWLSQPLEGNKDEMRALFGNAALLGDTDTLERFKEMRAKDELEVYLDWLDRMRLRMKDQVEATTTVLDSPDVRIHDNGDDKIGPMEMRLCLLMVAASDARSGTARDGELRLAREACRGALRGDLPANRTQDSATAAALAAAKDAKTRIRAAEEEASRLLGVQFAALYYEALVKAVPALHNYISSMQEARGVPLEESDSQLLAAVDKDPASYLPTYGEAVSRCAFLRPKDRSRGIPIQALAHLSTGAGPPAPGPVPATSEDEPNGGNAHLFRLPCPGYVTVPVLLSALGLIEDALERDPALRTRDVDLRVAQRSPDREALQGTGRMSGDALELVRDSPVPGLVLYGRDWVPLDEISPRCLATRIESERFSDGAPGMLGDRGHRFAEFFNTQIVRRSNDCYVDVLQNMFWSETPEAVAAESQAAGSGGVIQVAAAAGHRTAAADADDKWKEFRALLEATNGKSAEAQPASYSYGLSPRLRRGFTSEQSVNAGASLAWNGNGAEMRDTQQFSGVVYDPEIVGFTPRVAGRGCETPHPAGRACDQARAAGFGWIIGPRREGPGASWRRLAVEQAQLGAFVAVPSWWRTVLLRVCTGFATERELPQAPDWWAIENAPWDRKPGGDCRVHALRLPGTAAEFDRRLGMQVVRFPYIRPRPQEDATQVLRAGAPGSLLLEGGRLWRSTEVTVGAQRATRIRVLPNMEAIIAEFRCIDRPTASKPLPPEPGSGDQVFTVPIRVWTSEGVTQQELSVNVLVPASAERKRTVCEDDAAMPNAAPTAERGGDASPAQTP